MKIVIAMMKHETNTFSPIVTDWNRFENWGAYFGKKAFEVYENTGMPMAAYIDLAKEIKADIITPVAAEAMPSGIVTADIDATIVCSAPEYDRQRSPAGVIAEYLGQRSGSRISTFA